MTTQLILNKRGTQLSLKDGRFLINGGDQSQSVAVNNISSIVLHQATKITYDVIKTAVDNDIDVLFVDRKGNSIARIWSNKFGSIATVRKNQLVFAQHHAASLNFIKKILVKKLENQCLVLSLVGLFATPEHEKPIANSIAKIKQHQNKILKIEPSTQTEVFATLRGYEGQASALYFNIISKLLPEQYAFAGRSRQPAIDMFNSLLNYAYGMMYSMVEGALIESGIDPFVGIFHRDDYNRPVLTYDVIEKYRHWCDYVVINLCMQQAIFIEYFEIENGGFYLNDPGKKILITSFNDYMDEVIDYNGNSRSRLHHLKLDGQKLASLFKNFKP